jgi:hypothetical protein
MLSKDIVPEDLRYFLTGNQPLTLDECLEEFDDLAKKLFEAFLGSPSSYQEQLHRQHEKIKSGEFNIEKIEQLHEEQGERLNNPMIPLEYHGKLALTYRLIVQDFYEKKLHIEMLVEIANAKYHLGAALAAYELAFGLRQSSSEKNGQIAQKKNKVYERSAEHFAKLIIEHAPSSGWKTKLQAAGKLNDQMIEYENITLNINTKQTDITERLTTWMRDRECVKLAIIGTLKKPTTRK